jgi:HD-GYP domain-containing protein (c-di-GMP phosphodiesterase class II)
MIIRPLPNYIFLDYRQKLLRALLQICILLMLLLLAVNLLEWTFDPATPWRLENVVADLAFIGFLGVFYWMGERGWVQVPAWGFLALMIVLIPQSYSPSELNQALAILTLPVALSSFLIFPWSSFLFTVVILVFYLAVYYLYPGIFEFDFFSVLVLPVLAGGSYFISTMLNDTIQEIALAYDETIQGWATALEMRDSETMGHSSRVCELTLALARKLNVPENFSFR